jgi:thiol-disulfide isomerase/thioredoxin
MKLPKSTKSIIIYSLIFIIGLHIIIPCCSSREGFGGKKELLFLTMDGCGFCKKFMPEWKKFLGLNNTSISTKMVEKDEDKSLVKKHGVSGFPSVLLLDSGGNKLKTYDGPRTSQGLLDFCKKND